MKAWALGLAAAAAAALFVLALAFRQATVQPNALSRANAMVRGDKKFEDIESQMAKWGKEVDAALDASDQARIKLTRARTELILKTTYTTKAYAKAVLADPSAPAQARDAARRVLDLRREVVKADRVADKAVTLKEARAALRSAHAAKWDMLTVAQDMMTGKDAARPVDLPPTSKPLGDCPTNQKWAPERGTPQQRKIMGYLRDKGLEFVAHLHASRPEMQSTHNVLRLWNRQIVALSAYQDATSGTNGSFNYDTGCLGVALDSFSSLPRMLTRVLHELTHASLGPGYSHGPEFYKAFREYLRIATEELGWTVETTCRETCFGAGFEAGYDPKAACPKCVWQEDPGGCSARAAQCEPQAKNREHTARRHAEPEVMQFLGI